MKTAAIYCRVSTEDQEREGTSLQTQLEACLNYCQDKGYDVAYRFSEAYSGLTLDRPKLNELRELIRIGDIDTIVVYCLDRLSRDPTHGVILTQELQKHSVTLEAVIEDIDTSELGKLISYIRGFASKLEAEKIRERTMRGKKAKAAMGKIPGGGFHRLYGYNYLKLDNVKSARRVINETESKWVKQVYHWLVDESMSTSAITYRLRALNAPTKYGGLWCRAAVLNILKNPAYTGATYAFTTVGRKQFSKNRDEWIELPDVTPALISQEMFEAAQKQLAINRERSPRNVKRQYLLRGHIRCRQCGRAYYGCVTNDRIGSEHKKVRRYRCSGKLKMIVPVDRCINSSWQADRIEDLVWKQIQDVLNRPDLMIAEIEKQRQDTDQLGFLEAELQQVERQLRALNHDQEQLLQWALKGFPEQTVITENKRINEKRNNLQTQKAELEAQVKAGQEAVVTLPKLERFVELMREKLVTLDYATKRMVLEMLNIKVWIDGQSLEITGTLPIPDDAIVTTQS